jgi:hypothetical protein
MSAIKYPRSELILDTFIILTVEFSKSLKIVDFEGNFVKLLCQNP